MIIGLQSSDGHIQYLRNLLVRQIIIIAHIENQFLLLWQSLYRLLQQNLDFFPIFSGCISYEILHVIFCIFICFLHPVHFVELLQSLVGCNPVEPSVQFAITLELMNVLIRFDKSILQNILSLVVIYNQTSDMPIKATLIDIHHRAQTFLYSLRCS